MVRATRITECVGMEGDLITIQDIFVLEKTGLTENRDAVAASIFQTVVGIS